MTNDELDNIIKTSELIVVLFGNKTTNTLKLMNLIKQVVDNVLVLDYDENTHLAIYYNVRNLPLAILFKDGKFSGTISLPTTKAKIEDLCQQMSL